MTENLSQHFSKKILFLSLLFLLVSTALYAVSSLSKSREVYRSVAPKIVFASSQGAGIKTLYDNDFHAAAPNQELIAGTRIKTGKLQYAEIVLDNNIIRLDENTEVVITENNFSEYSAYEKELPRLVFGLSGGNVWVNASDRIEIDMPRSSARFAHSVGIVTYSGPLNRVMVVTGSADLELYGENGELFASYAVPLNNQVTYTDTQIVPDYARLHASKLKKELKLAPIAKMILEDEWVKRNTAVDIELAKSKITALNSGIIYAFENNLYKIRAYLTFLPKAKRELTLDRANLILRYLLGGVSRNGDSGEAKTLLADLDSITSGMAGDPLLKEMFTGVFDAMGTPEPGTPAYFTKEYLSGYIFSQDGPQVLRAYLSDIRNSLAGFKLDVAENAAQAWFEKWRGREEENMSEWGKQSQMLHRIIISYADRVTTGILDVFDRTGQRRLDIAKGSEEARFDITEERLEISSALVAAFRYLAAKHYLKTSYESLGIDTLDTKLASREIFLERAKLLAQRIEYAEEVMHGAAAPIDETAFSEYMQKKTRDELLSENLKTFLRIGEAPGTETKLPTTSEVIERFANARISVIEEDITPDSDSPFSFGVKNARLIERAPDGSLASFDATYDFAANAVDNVVAKNTPFKGTFELNDLVAILIGGNAKTAGGGAAVSDISGLLTESGENDEALRAQITAQNLAIQLAINDLEKAEIMVDKDSIEIMDSLNLNKFRVPKGSVSNPLDLKNPILISFDYDSSLKLISNAYSGGGLITSKSVSPEQLVYILFGGIYAEKEKEQALKDFQKDLGASFIIDNTDIGASGFEVIFSGLHPKALPLYVNGVYDLSMHQFRRVSGDLYSAENIAIKPYFTELAYLYIIDYLGKNGITVARNQISTSYPFETVRITDYKSNGQTFSFDLDIAANMLRNITIKETGAFAKSVTFPDFLNILAKGAD
jgi:hypothetical protein